MRDDDDGTVDGVTLARDAISDFWDDDGNPDGEADREPEGNVPSSWTDFDEGGFGAVSVGSGTADVTIEWEDLDEGTLGVTSWSTSNRRTIEGATIRIDNEIESFAPTDEDYKNILAHELGHAIGLGHSGGPANLMHPFARGYDAYQPLGRSSIGTLNRLYG